jgi:hypothetical protein
MLPNFPLYIVSKGRWESRLTSKTLEAMHLPYHVVIEAQEYDQYAAVIAPQKLLVLDPAYQRTYETCDTLGRTRSPGPGPARNFVWDHAAAARASWHWVMDDNIRWFYRLHRNKKYRVADGVVFRCMEDFVSRYANVAMAGPNYEKFAKRHDALPPFVLNTRIYSCNLIRTDLPYRWRGRYNEDTDLSLRMLKDGWCTIQFNAFLQGKIATQTMKGGCTTEFYAHEGTWPKSQMMVQLHPDVARLVWKFGRWHHQVDYRRFKTNRLRRCPGAACETGVNDYGMRLVPVSADSAVYGSPATL